METIPIKKPWKNPERIFFRRFKKGEPYYGLHCTYVEGVGDKCEYRREQAHCRDWYAVVYLGIDVYGDPAYYTLMGWRGFLDKEDAAKHLAEYRESRKAIGLENVPPYHTQKESEKAIKAHFAA